jgi:hypothetical protein
MNLENIKMFRSAVRGGTFVGPHLGGRHPRELFSGNNSHVYVVQNKHKAISKLIPIEQLWMDSEVSMDWKLDKLERKSSYNLFQGLVAQVDTTLGIDSLASSTIPDSLLIDPASGQQTIVIDFDSGNDPQLEDGLDDASCVLPPDWKWTDVLSVIHLLDRGSVGRGTVWFGSTAGRLNWAFAWGQNHDEWNAVRAPAKTIQPGRIWKSVVKFSGIANIPAGPYRSGAWGQQRREIHGKQVQGLLSKDHPEFIESAQKQFELDGRAFCDERLDDY